MWSYKYLGVTTDQLLGWQEYDMSVYKNIKILLLRKPNLNQFILLRTTYTSCYLILNQTFLTCVCRSGLNACWVGRHIFSCCIPCITGVPSGRAAALSIKSIPDSAGSWNTQIINVKGDKVAKEKKTSLVLI